MGTKYRQLDIEERCEIARLRAGGASIRKIAATLDRPASTISREMKRNSGKQVGYKPAYADEQAWSRRWRGSRLARQPALQSRVLGLLAMGMSPEQVCGRLTLEEGKAPVSPESIYRFIYTQIRRTNDFSWRRYLPRGKSKRGFRGKKGGSPANFIPERVSIHQRPLYIERRRQGGHWEADLMLFSKYGQAVLIAHERSSRALVVTRLETKEARPVSKKLYRILKKMPQSLRRSITFDNGTEFTHHTLLKKKLNMKTYFCDTHSPWQKGGIENAIGRLRRFLPRKTDLTTISQKELDALTALYNNTPRKCLDFKTPAEVLSRHLLHFECESTGSGLLQCGLYNGKL
jgi:transposase, IS30 family